jgi:hypothetical protein
LTRLAATKGLDEELLVVTQRELVERAIRSRGVEACIDEEQGRRHDEDEENCSKQHNSGRDAQ